MKQIDPRLTKQQSDILVQWISGTTVAEIALAHCLTIVEVVGILEDKKHIWEKKNEL